MNENIPSIEQIVDASLAMTSMSKVWEEVFIGMLRNGLDPTESAKLATDAVRAALVVIHPSVIRYAEDRKKMLEEMSGFVPMSGQKRDS